MTEEERRKYCDMHSLETDRICRARNDIQKLFDGLADRVRMKTLLWILGSLITIMMGFSATNLQMNLRSIAGSKARHTEQQKQVEKIMEGQNDLRLDMKSMEGVLHEVQVDVDELKQDMRSRR